jgi:glyoxylase-like metal-dependent hydrolase (beta-lactamase superfamily II)
MTKALADLGGDPVTHLINTHWHFDHTDGNAWLNSLGAKIIAQENTLGFLSHVQRVEDWDYNIVSAAPNGLPSEVFTSQRSLNLNGQSINLKHYNPAHTDSDISVTFAEADIVHVADTFWNGVYPFIDYSTGGSIDGMIAASDANLGATTDKTIIIPGHGQPVSNRAELQQFRNGCGKTDGRLRRQIRQLGHRSRLLHQVGLRRRVILAGCVVANTSVRFCDGTAQRKGCRNHGR